MYCPKCSQPQASAAAQFCPRCGAALPGPNESEAALARPPARDELSPRQKGVRQGAALMLLSVVLIPAYVLLAALFPAEDRLVESSPSDTPFEKVSQAVLVTLFLLGLARVVYARLFERGAGQGEATEEAGRVSELDGAAPARSLPPSQGIPAHGFGTWRVSTGELAERRGGAERTTRSLEHE